MAFKRLKPIGQLTEADHPEVIGLMTALVEEATDARGKWDAAVRMNWHLYTYGEEQEPDPDQIVVPEIQNAVVAITDLQCKEPPRGTLEAVETGEPKLYFWQAPPGMGLDAAMAVGLRPDQIAPGVDELGQPAPQAPLDELQAGMLKSLSFPDEVMPALPPGCIRPEWLAEVSDQTTAEMYQQLLDVYWERSEDDLFVEQLQLDNNIQGWTFGLVEFDEQRQRFANRHLPIKMAYIDPLCRDIAEAAYFGFDIALDAYEASSLYPHLADAIEEWAQEGTLTKPDSRTQWSSQFEMIFKRPMVVFRVFFLRNQEAVYDPERAEAEGLVVRQQRLGTLRDGDGGSPVLDGEYFTLADGVTEVEPGGPGWPKRLAIRQLTQVGNAIVDDRECEHCDIPVLHNVNIPLPGITPFGLGEPYRMRCISQAESRILDAMVKHTEYYASPVAAMSRRMYDDLGPDAIAAGVQPGLVLKVDDELFRMNNGQVMAIQNPPPLSEGHMGLFPIVKQLSSEVSGNTEIVQGRASSSAQSGRAIEMLQSAATSMLSYKSRRLGKMTKRLVNLMVYQLVWRLDVDQVAKVVSKYNRNVLELLIRRARMIEWNVTPQINAGTGGVQAQRRATAAEDLQLGAITIQTYRERANIDHRQEQQRELALLNQQQRYAGAMTTGMPMPGGDTQPGQGQQPGGGGVGGGPQPPTSPSGAMSVGATPPG